MIMRFTCSVIVNYIGVLTVIKTQDLLSNSVVQWSAGDAPVTVSTDDMDFKIGFVRNLQVPPRAPKEKSSQSGWLFSFGAAIFAFGELNLLCKLNWLAPAKLPAGSWSGEYNLADAYGINIAFTK